MIRWQLAGGPPGYQHPRRAVHLEEKSPPVAYRVMQSLQEGGAHRGASACPGCSQCACQPCQACLEPQQNRWGPCGEWGARLARNWHACG